MNEIDFLPLDYVMRRRRRGQRWRQGIVVGLLAMAMLGWALLAQGRIMQLEARTQEAQTRTLMLQVQARQLQSLQDELADLNRRLALRRELAPPVTLTQSVAQIAGHIPEKTCISSLSLTDSSPVVRKKKEETPGHPVSLGLHIGLTGLAESNTQVADLVARLTADPLLTQVKLLYSRPVSQRDGFGREYRIEMDIPLDRDYRRVDQASQEVADAN